MDRELEVLHNFESKLWLVRNREDSIAKNLRRRIVEAILMLTMARKIKRSWSV